YVLAGKALCLLGRIARGRSDCVSDVSAVGRCVQSVVALRPGLLCSACLSATARNDGYACRKVVRGCKSSSGADVKCLELEILAGWKWHLYYSQKWPFAQVHSNGILLEGSSLSRFFERQRKQRKQR